MVTKKDVFRLLEELGIRHDDKITVHSSLRAVGAIENGADGLIDAFCEYLSDGLLLIPTHTWAGFVQRLAFDVRTQEPCLGILSKVAAFRPDAVRSLHPTHSVAAFGKTAAAYVRGEETCATPTPVHSCLSRLYDEGGKILLLGVGMDSNTYLHAAEERIGVPNRIWDQRFIVKLTDAAGNTFDSVPFTGFHTQGVPEGASEHFGNYEKPLKACAAASYSTLGNAQVICCDARRTVEVLETLWKHANYDLCSCDREIPTDYYAELLEHK